MSFVCNRTVKGGRIAMKYMTYNIRNMNDDHGPHAWDNRKEHLAALIAWRAPDILCVQEAFWPQMVYLKEHLPGYDFYGVGRDDGDKAGEYAAVFYRTDRFTLLEGRTFWLSETPDRPSRGWDASFHKRICTIAVLAPLDGGTPICAASLHLDNDGAEARRQSALLLRRVFTPISEQYQCFIAGDYNAEPCDEPFRIMNEPPFYDARTTADEFSDFETFNGFAIDHVTFGAGPIDHIFYTKGALRPVCAEILTTKRGGDFPSDHFPLLCTFE